MAILPILVTPHPCLKETAQPVDSVDETIRTLMDDMLETMYEAPGIGLAAPQVGVSKRVIVIDIAAKGEDPAPLCIANPEITWVSDEINTYEEGCLSVPAQYAEVKRPAQVKVKFLDRNNTEQEVEADGLLATCLQHEIDHLNGTLFIDHLSKLKRDMVLRKLKKHLSTATQNDEA